MPGGFWTREYPPPALPLNELDLFQPWQAERIVEFVQEHDALNIVVNCEGGLSRSPSVALALSHRLGQSGSLEKAPCQRIYQMVLQSDRLRKLAFALGMTPTGKICLRLGMETGRRRWWLTGCLEGDQPLPATGKAETATEALNAAENWLKNGGF
jgi:hypothetical protein